MNRPVPYVALGTQYLQERERLEPRIHACLASGQWIGGPCVDELEAAVAAHCRSRFAVALGSGTDALIFSLHALGIGHGDEVITASNSFVATAAAIVAVGATPVFADVLPDRNLDPSSIASRLTSKTKAILPVHLGGRIAAMHELSSLAHAHNVMIVEDAAQAFGSTLGGQFAGTFGRCGCFSAHPLKNLNACGDAGFVVTDDPNVAETVRQLGNNGLRDRNSLARWGRVSRLDAIQATILRFRLETLDGVLEARRRNAAIYIEGLEGLPLRMPELGDGKARRDTFHTFVIQSEERDALRTWLSDHGIETAVHYPVPIHLQPPARALGWKEGDLPQTEHQARTILSLPIHQFLEPEDLEWVITSVRGFYHR